jgi:hypothetical protein
LDGQRAIDALIGAKEVREIRSADAHRYLQ